MSCGTRLAPGVGEAFALRVIRLKGQMRHEWPQIFLGKSSGKMIIAQNP